MRLLPAALMLSLLGAMACSDRPELVMPGEPRALDVRLETSEAAVGPRGMIAVAVRADATGGSVTGLQGTLRFDARRWRYAGQDESRYLLMVSRGTAETGVLRFLAWDGDPLPSRVAVFTFEVIETGASAPTLVAEAAVDQDLTELVIRPAPARVAFDLHPPERPWQPSLEDWFARLDPVAARNESAAVLGVPGQYVPSLRFGDVTLNGVINVLDVAAAANVSVGNQSLLTDVARDYVVAGNVMPANLPGLGEVGDVLPPGHETDGSLVLNVLDVAAIGNESIGNNHIIAGELIPGREPRPGNRVVLSGTIDSAGRTLTRDTIWELHGTVTVPGGATLTIEPGTRIEGDQATRGALVVHRGGNLHAVGTRLQPIVFTCDETEQPAAAGCWGGVAINGFALLNNGVGVVEGEVQCPEQTYPTSPEPYGGCLEQDDSGMLRFVRIEYAGRPVGAGPSLPGLALLGVGTGTLIDSIQVHRSLGHGIYVSGSQLDLRAVVLTDNEQDALRWSNGWRGRVQSLLIHRWATAALHGLNADTAEQATPRSNPLIYHVTMVGGGAGAQAGPALWFEKGTAGTIRDAIVLEPSPEVLDIDGQRTCDQANGVAMPGLRVQWSIFAVGQFAADSDDCAGDFDEAAWAVQAPLFNRVTDPQLLAPLVTLSPDIRPAAGGAATTGFTVPPADGFFNTSAMYVGAAAAANTQRTNVPWYAGWTVGF